jgi:hypothetical protein
MKSIDRCLRFLLMSFVRFIAPLQAKPSMVWSLLGRKQKLVSEGAVLHTERKDCACILRMSCFNLRFVASLACSGIPSAAGGMMVVAVEAQCQNI